MKQLTSLLGLALILFISSCKKDPVFIPTLTMTSTSIQVLTDGGSRELEISSNTDWKITVPAEATGWVNLDRNTGKGNAKVTITISPNSNTQTRSAILVLEETGTGDIAPISITVEQGAFSATLNADKASIQVAPEGSTELINISSNIDWKLTIPAGTDWVTADLLSAQGNRSVNFTVKPNAGAVLRKVEIKLEAQNNNSVSPVNITIEQQATISSIANYTKEWEKILSGLTGNPTGELIVQSPDGGYLTANRVSKNNDALTELLLVKIDAEGVTKWTQTYGAATGLNQANAMVAVNDGYVLTGYTTRDNKGADIWIIKTNLKGELVWEKTWGGSLPEYSYSIAATADGYVVTGSTSNATSSQDVLALKLDGQGNIVWEKTFTKEGATNQGGYSIVADGTDFLIAATDNGRDSFQSDLWLIKINSAGGLVWDKTYMGKSFAAKFKLAENAGGYFIAGSKIGDSGTHIYKVDKNGGLLWEKDFGTSSLFNNSVKPTPDNGFILTGSDGSTNSMFTGKYDSNGNLLWSALYANPAGGKSYGQSLATTADGFVVLGNLQASSGAAYTPLLLKYKQL